MFHDRNKKLGLIILGIFISVGVYFLGFRQGLNSAAPQIVYRDNPPIDADFALFWKVWDVFKKKYIHSKDLSDRNILYGAITGLVDSAGDPFTVFLKPDDAQKFEEDLSGSFGGIGAEIGIRDNQLVIIAPLKGSPAEKAGLKSGDKILKINDIFTANLTAEEAVKQIRGIKGTKVVLLISREGGGGAKEYPIIRDTVIVPTLDWEIKENNIAYIHLYNFNENASLLFYRAVLEISLKGVKGIVLDLRDNPGGYLETAVDIGGWFLERGTVIVKQEFSSGQEELFKSSGSAILGKMPLVVLINQGSASASEILAGALRVQLGAKLIGEKSFGKGTIQDITRFDDGSEAKISIAQWLLPNGDLIDKKGLSPDIEVKISDEEIKGQKDPQLEKAMEIIKAEIK